MEPRKSSFALLGRADFLFASPRMQRHGQADPEAPQGAQGEHRAVPARPRPGPCAGPGQEQEESDRIKDPGAAARSSLRG